MKKIFYLPLFLGTILVSCNSDNTWNEENKEEFVSSCESSFVSGFESTMGDNMDMVDRDELNKLASDYCSCSFEFIKKKYDSPEEAFTKGTDALLEEIEGSQDCEITDEDINKLLKQ